MKKRDLSLGLILVLFLGASATLALDSLGWVALRRPLRAGEARVADTLVASPESDQASGSSSSALALIVSATLPTMASPHAIPAPLPIAVGPEKGEDIEDVLLLYDSNRPSNFSVNFCKIAEFYGLICKRLALDATDLTAESLRDAHGAYFRLVGLDASVLLPGSDLLSAAEIAILKSAIDTGWAKVLISKITPHIDATLLSDLTGGAVLGVVGLEGAQHHWIVSSAAPEVTREFTGQVISSPSATPLSEAALLLVDPVSSTALISSSDNAGMDIPVFVRWKQAAGAVYLDAGIQAASLDQFPLRDMVYDAARFSQIVPLMLVMRAALGDEAWHSDQDYANLTIDDPALVEPFYNLSYIGLLREMLAHDFHTTIALIPARWEQSQPEVVTLFQHYPDRFSLVQHGNNHDGYEFYSYRTTGKDNFISRPFNAQAWDIQEGLARMEMHRSLTGLAFDPVMVFPWGIPPEPTMGLLKKHNYLATVNQQDVPLDTARPTDWDYGMHPAILNYENFPVITRRYLGNYQSFQPDVQPIIFDLFVDKPALFFTHAYEKELFAGGIDAFNPVADQINSLSGGVEWQSLGTILRRLHLEKTNDDGSLDIRMYGNDLILTNESPSERAYHIVKEETLIVPIAALTVNGQEFPYRLEYDLLLMDVRLSFGATMEINIIY